MLRLFRALACLNSRLILRKTGGMRYNIQSFTFILPFCALSVLFTDSAEADSLHGFARSSRASGFARIRSAFGSGEGAGGRTLPGFASSHSVIGHLGGIGSSRNPSQSVGFGRNSVGEMPPNQARFLRSVQIATHISQGQSGGSTHVATHVTAGQNTGTHVATHVTAGQNTGTHVATHITEGQNTGTHVAMHLEPAQNALGTDQIKGESATLFLAEHGQAGQHGPNHNVPLSILHNVSPVPLPPTAR